MSVFLTIVSLIIVLASIIVHELAHGYAADWLGDPTPRLMGRLTLNPLKHIDLMGSLIFPGLLFIMGLPVIGWAKPVQFNPLNFKKYHRWGNALVAVVGPLSNILLAVIFAIVLRVGISVGFLNPIMMQLVTSIVLINISLALFNLVPIPPLDGHHILFAALSDNQFRSFKNNLIRYSLPLLVLFIMFGWRFLQPIVMAVAGFLIG